MFPASEFEVKILCRCGLYLLLRIQLPSSFNIDIIFQIIYIIRICTVFQQVTKIHCLLQGNIRLYTIMSLLYLPPPDVSHFAFNNVFPIRHDLRRKVQWKWMSRKRTYRMCINGGLGYNFSQINFRQVRIFHNKCWFHQRSLTHGLSKISLTFLELFMKIMNFEKNIELIYSP